MIFIFCTLAPLATCKQTQKFKKTPKNTSIKLGDTAVLNCSVSGSHGDVQWTHDGTALGYDRRVPGKPRYSVIWYENESLEYHLKIENVTMDDEGLFSCQAAPIGDWDTKLEAKAKLIVLVGPQNPPEMIFEDQMKKPGEIVNFRSMSKRSSKYTCIVRKSKPASIIKWYLDDKLITSKVGTSKSTKKKFGNQ